MAAPGSYARRQFPGAAVDTTISGGINNTDVSCALASQSGWPSGSFTGGILCELFSTSTGVTAEKVWATARSGATLTIVRGADGTSATSHAAGTGIRPVAGAIDADEANRAVNETIGQVSAAGQILVGDGSASMTALDAKTSGRILVGDGTTLKSVAVSGDVTLAANGAVTIGNDKVDSQHIAAGAIDLEHMSANSVDSDQYVDGSIDRVHLAADVIDGTKLADDAVNSEHIADGAINTAHIADDQVTLAKLAPAAKPRFALGGFTSDGVATSTTGSLWRMGSDLISVVMAEAGAVIGISVASLVERSAGTLTVEVTINGTGTGLTAVLNGTNTQYAYATQAETADAFVAGDRIGVSVVTSSWAPSSSNDIEAIVWCQAV